MEVNQRLMPIFLKEAVTNLGILRDYFLSCSQLQETREGLKAAYRAAHTIKGTSQLVQFKGINQISQRLEKALESHYLLLSEATRSEHDMLQQATELLERIVAVVQNKQPEPQHLVHEALALLDSVTTPLIFSNESTAALPSATHPLLDPFADDETFDQQLDSESDPNKAEEDLPVSGFARKGSADPFADDPDLPVFSEPASPHFCALDTESDLPQHDSPELSGPAQENPAAAGGERDFDLDHGDDFMPGSTPLAGSLLSLSLPEREIKPRRSYVCCAFDIGGHTYHLPIAYMVEITEIGPLLPLPMAPVTIKGLVNLRGQVMPVVDMSAFHQDNETIGETQRLVVAQSGNEKIAFLADGVPYLSEDCTGEEIHLPTFIDQHRIKGISA